MTKHKNLSDANKGPSIKDVRSQWRREEFVHCEQGGMGLRMWTSALLFGAKIIGFFEIYGVPTRTRRVEPVRTFCGQGGKGSILRDFVRTSFMEGP